MTDNYLSINEINDLASALKDISLHAYVNIGVDMGDGTVEIFKPENFDILLRRFLLSRELSVDVTEIKEMKIKFKTAFDKLIATNSADDLKIGKLCSAFILVKRKNWAAEWIFYSVPEIYRIPTALNYSLRPQVTSPVMNMAPSPVVFFQQNSSNKANSGSATRNQSNSGKLYGSQKKNFQGSGNASDSKSFQHSGGKNSRKSQNSRGGIPEPFGPVVSLFGGQISSINSRDSLVQSTIRQPILRESKLDVIRGEKSKLVNMITNSLEATPHTKILCNRANGVCTFERIDQDERFETSCYKYCAFHTGRTFDSFGTISETNRRKIVGPYGYFTSTSECYDSCFRTISESLSSDETIEIESRRNAVSKILSSVEENIVAFNNMVVSQEKLIASEISGKQGEHVATAEFVNVLGDNGDKNVSLLQTIATNELFSKTVKTMVKRQRGRKMDPVFSYPRLNIMGHKSISSFFGTLTNIINNIDNVDLLMRFTYTEGTDPIDITVPPEAQALILSNIKNVRDNITSVNCTFTSLGDAFQLKINNQPITFQLRGVSKLIATAVNGEPTLEGIDPINAMVDIIPRYNDESYRGSMFKLGGYVARNMGIYDEIMNRYDILIYIGVCSISKFNDFLDFANNDTDPENVNYSLVSSRANKYDIRLENIRSTIDSLNKAFSNSGMNDNITFMMNDEYELTLTYTEANLILSQLSNIPDIDDENMIFTLGDDDFIVPTNDAQFFFKELERNLTILSNRGKAEDIKAEDKLKSLTLNSMSSMSTESDGWTTFLSYKNEIVNDDESFNDGKSTIQSELESFGIKVKSTNSQRGKKGKKKSNGEYSYSETGTVVSGTTAFTNSTEFGDMSDNYNTTFFDETIEVLGHTMTAFDAQHLVGSYYSVRNLDFESGVIKININSILLTRSNLTYIISVIFEEDDEIIEVLYNEDDEMMNRKLSLVYLFFASKCNYFNRGSNKIKLCSELRLINPLKSRHETDFAISSSEARKAKLLNKMMINTQIIDKTAILARKNTIETLGLDIFNSIFTGFQPQVGENKETVNSTNKELVINMAGEIFRSRIMLSNFYSGDVLRFLERIASQDNITDRQSSYYDTVGEYHIFHNGNDYSKESNFVVPNNPMYATNNSASLTSIFPNNVDILVNQDGLSEEQINSRQMVEVDPIETLLASKEMINAFEILFPGENTVSLSRSNPNFQRAVDNTKYANHILKLGYMIKFFELTDNIIFSEDIAERKRRHDEDNDISTVIRENEIATRHNARGDSEDTMELKPVPARLERTALISDTIDNIVGRLNELSLGLSTDEIGNKIKGNLPAIVNLPTHIDTLENEIRDFIERIGPQVIQPTPIYLLPIFDKMIKHNVNNVEDSSYDDDITKLQNMISFFEHISKTIFFEDVFEEKRRIDEDENIATIIRDNEIAKSNNETMENESKKKPVLQKPVQNIYTSNVKSIFASNDKKIVKRSVETNAKESKMRIKNVPTKLEPQKFIRDRINNIVNRIEIFSNNLLPDNIDDVKTNVENFETEIRELFKDISPQVVEKSTTAVDLYPVFKCIITPFNDVFSIFNDRRIVMRNYVKKMISNVYDVKVNAQNELVHDNIFHTFIDIENESQNGNDYVANPDKNDVIQLAIDKIVMIVDMLKTRKLDPTLVLTNGTPLLDLKTRFEIFNKFSQILLNTTGAREFNSIQKSIYYYFISSFDKGIYENFLLSNYEFIMGRLTHGCSLEKFKENQDAMAINIAEMNLVKTKKAESSASLKTISSKISAIKDKIESEKGLLIDRFIEYVSIIDIIVKTYENTKKSYGAEDFKFNELIINIKSQLDSVIKSYNNVNNLEMKIILSIFSDNFEIYNIRKSIFREFRYEPEHLSSFDGLVKNSIDFIKTYSKLSFTDQINTLNSKIEEYGLNVNSNYTELENIIRDHSKEKATEISSMFFKCKFTFSLFSLMKKEIENIKYRLSTNKIKPINIPSREDQPKIDNYGSRLNFNITSNLVNSFTLNDVQTLSKSCYHVLDTIGQGLRVIDSGPGLHLLSDSLEFFKSTITYQKNGDEIEAFEEFKKFKASFQRFIKFSKKSISDIIQSSEFRVFVDVINGKLDVIDSVKDSIEYYKSSPNPYPVYENLTSDFISSILYTMNELYTVPYASSEMIFTTISKHGIVKYDDENVNDLIRTTIDFNDAIIPFIDEYIDDNNNVLNDTQVIELRDKYNLKTSGLYMNRMFEKLNYCIRKFIDVQNTDFETRIIERFIIYIELFLGKFKTLKNLEMYMIKK